MKQSEFFDNLSNLLDWCDIDTDVTINPNDGKAYLSAWADDIRDYVLVSFKRNVVTVTDTHGGTNTVDWNTGFKENMLAITAENIHKILLGII